MLPCFLPLLMSPILFSLMWPRIGVLVAELVVPEIEAVHVVRTEPEAALVLMVDGFDRVDSFHRPVARDDGAGRGAERIKVRLHRLVALHDEVAIGLSVDLDMNAAVFRGNLHLRESRRQAEGG